MQPKGDDTDGTQYVKFPSGYVLPYSNTSSLIYSAYKCLNPFTGASADDIIFNIIEYNNATHSVVSSTWYNDTASATITVTASNIINDLQQLPAGIATELTLNTLNVNLLALTALFPTALTALGNFKVAIQEKFRKTCLKSETITVTNTAQLLSALSSGVPAGTKWIRLQTHADSIRYSEQGSSFTPTTLTGAFLDKYTTIDIDTGSGITLIIDDGGTNAAVFVTYYS